MKDDYFLGAKSNDGSPCPVNGFGHVFSAYFIANALEDNITPDAKKQILSRIDRERVDGLWGFGEGKPLDSDDTVFVLRTLQLLGAEVSWRPLMRFYSPEDRLFKTFLGKGPCKLETIRSATGNRGAHLEVNANVQAFLSGTHDQGFVNLDCIANQQSMDGGWSGYFYPGNYYSTYFCIVSLLYADNHCESIKRAIQFIESNQNTDGSWGSNHSNYSTALALNSLAVAGRVGPTHQRGVNFLQNNQLADGSWESDDLIYRFVYQDEPKIEWQAQDINRVVTTSLCVSAIRHTLQGPNV